MEVLCVTSSAAMGGEIMIKSGVVSFGAEGDQAGNAMAYAAR